MNRKLEELEELDEEWVELILAARSMGIDIEEIRAFLGGSPHSQKKWMYPAEGNRHVSS